MNSSSPGLQTRKKQIGAFFTPLWIAGEMVRTYGLHKAWAEGRSLLDPTAGSGHLLEALIDCCLKEEIPVTGEMLGRLKGIEREEEFICDFNGRILNRYGIVLPDDVLIKGDFLKEKIPVFDIIFGNPPWLNFTDLPEDEKEEMKDRFRQYGLVERGMKTLLGGSRIDLAALIIQKAVQDHLIPGGSGYFFIPLSLILNEGAHNRFRRGRLKGDCFGISEIRDFGENRIFKDVSTRCGFGVFRKSESGRERIPYFVMTAPGKWKQNTAGPAGPPGSAFRILDDEKQPAPIRMSSLSRPRQGINTGGRNSIFIFDSAEECSGNMLVLKNSTRTVRLPEALIYPLITSGQFKGGITPSRYIFLPYSRQGKVLEEDELKLFPEVMEYLTDHRESLSERKGSMLRSMMKSDRYWSLLGVGPYTFAPWKIVWESYGRKEFKPQLFGYCGGKPWIPNQALQASCAFESESEAKRVLSGLENPDINRILKQHNMEGTCNWAQPGRIIGFLKFDET